MLLVRVRNNKMLSSAMLPLLFAIVSLGNSQVTTQSGRISRRQFKLPEPFQINPQGIANSLRVNNLPFPVNFQSSSENTVIPDRIDFGLTEAQRNFGKKGNFAVPTIEVDATVAEAASREVQVEILWNSFKKQYNKVYATPEQEKFRREIFIENMHKIEYLNYAYSIGQASFVQQLNRYSDMLHNEFNTILNGFNRTKNGNVPRPRSSAYIPSANVPFPDRIDWRELGAVTSVKQQGMCGACYAFSAAGAVEGQHFRKTGILRDLSPQQIIDCSQLSTSNDGCNGGLIEPAFEYLKATEGLDTEEAYPYEAQNNTCRFRPEAVGAIVTGHVTLPEGDETALKIAVATIGPVSVAIDASRDSLQFYSDGVYFDRGCKNDTESLNHAVLVVGYGSDSDGRDYWLVKNTYGAQWGNGGYIKIARNVDNHCGIASLASYPLV